MIINNNVPITGKIVASSTAGTSYATTVAYFCNVSQNITEILNVYLVSKDGGINNQSLIVSNLAILPTDTFVFDVEKLILENGDYLYATSSSGNISATVSVMNIT